MHILILGGTIFLGRALVDAALAGGHTLTLFNRGSSNPGLFPEVERVIGDRQVDLSALRRPPLGCRHRHLRLPAWRSSSFRRTARLSRGPVYFHLH